MSMSRTDRLKAMHDRRLRWQPIPRCRVCGRVLAVRQPDGSAPCERCLTVDGEIVADTTAAVAAAFEAAAADPEALTAHVRSSTSVWDARLQAKVVSCRVASGTGRRARGWAVLRVTPGFGLDVERFALVESATAEAVRVVLAGVAASARVTDVRTGRTLVVSAP
jgi:hypothetical protein